MSYITEASKKTPVKYQADLCVIGGSCTGVFAAIRAARLGLKVVILEKQNMLGGTATSGLVNIWHSLHNIDYSKQIIAGLTYEVIERLKINNAVTIKNDPNHAYEFNPWELTVILDDMIREENITCLLHTLYVDVCMEDEKIKAVIAENNDGRFAIESKFFIDASGDGRVARDLGLECYEGKNIQPPTSCFYLMGETKGINVGKLILEHGEEFGLEDDWGWNTPIHNMPGITMRADNHVFDVRSDRADDLTKAEIQGRFQARALARLLRKYGHPESAYPIVAMCSHIGIRETIHFKSRYKADSMELLTGKRYDAPILNGSYRIDIHHSEDKGITFRYLDGREVVMHGRESCAQISDWREREGITGQCATYYQLPFDAIVQEEIPNFIAVGRMIDADEGAFGALRVMINLNQLGEAAGVSAYHCINQSMEIFNLDGKEVTKTLCAGGSAL